MAELHAKIDQFALENDFLSGALGKPGLLSGANQGAQIISYEPSPSLFETLVANTKQHHLINCINEALSDCPGTMTLHIYPELQVVNNLASNTPYNLRYPSNPHLLPCPINTVDLSLKKLGIPRVSFLKIDVEGFELNVLKGAKRALEAGAIDYVCVEFNEVRGKSEHKNAGALLPIVDLISPFGFEFICAYTDSVAPDGDHFVVCNALFERRERSTGQV